MDAVTLWHNPACSKSRAALDVLRQRRIEPLIRDYLGDPPDAAELGTLLRRLALPARDLLRAGEADHARFGLDDRGLGASELIAAMAAHPHLIERPILVVGERAVIARPSERIGELLDAAV